MEYVIGINWGTSRGRDTYGYTTCTGYVDGKRLASCSGGGYDLRFTTLAGIVVRLIQADLMKLGNRAADTWDRVTKVRTHNPDQSLYGSTLYMENGVPKHFGIDGACGDSAVRSIVDAAGWRLRCIDQSSRREVWQLIRNPSPTT